jgi:hypothetical protein
MNYFAVSTIDTNRDLDIFGYENCLNLKRMERTISNDTLFIDVIVGAVLLWFLLVSLEIL